MNDQLSLYTLRQKDDVRHSNIAYIKYHWFEHSFNKSKRKFTLPPVITCFSKLPKCRL